MQILEEVALKKERRLPLTQSQKELWLLAQIESQASVAYNVCNAVELRGPLLVSALQKALRTVVGRHDALRASVGQDGETLTVASESLMELELEDISHLSGPERQECLRHETARKLDLAAPPLLRAKLFQTGPQEHALLLTSHHIVVDGASMQTMLRELGVLYSDFLDGRDSRLPAPPGYAAYVERQEKIRGTEKWSASEEYWLRQFRTQPPVLEMPADELRPGAKTYNGAAESLLIEPALAEDLKALSAAHSATLFMTLFAGFAALVRRLSGQEDLVLGINVSRRSRKADQGLVGYLTTLLPIRIAVSQMSPFSELLATTRDTLLAAIEHREYGLGDLVRKLNPERVPGRSPLVDVTFNFDRNGESLQFAGLETQPIPAPLTAAKYDLDFNVIETGRGLLCYAEYNTDLFHPETIRRFLRLWRNLLSGLAAQPQASLLDLPWMDSQERQQAVFDWNRTQKPYPQGSIAERLEAQASRTPNATAVAYEGVELNYRELNEKANRLAHHLISAGVGRETRVGIYLERGLNWVVSILAVWKAGGVYVPLDIAYPKDRLAFMLEDAEAGALLTEESLQAELPPHASRTICLDLEWESIDRQSAENPGARIYPEDLAYVIFTSGSTGRPKGAMIEHGGMMNHLWAKVDDLGMSAEDIVAQNAPASFDVSVWQVFSALLVGGVVQIIGEEIARDGVQLLAEVHRLGATVLETVPTLLGAMVEQQQEYGERRLSLQKLRWMISNAEPLPVSLCRQWAALYPRVQLVNAYGQTECSDDVNHLLVEGPLTGLKYAPLGKPLKNMRLYVLDEGGQPVPIGVAGELHVGGICVGRGYLGRPELTAEKFVPDTFSEDTGARLYKTSDRVRLLPDGSFDFVARLDHQVKLRGFRIELPEIEATLNQHPGVIRSVVIVREDEPGDKRLVGYVVARAGVDGASLKAYLRERLPHYMAPSAIELLDRMPLTANEKIDRAALPKPRESQRDSNQEYLAPRNRLEETLAEIWAEVLRVEQVGIEDNFFELGGHSLLAIQVIAKIRKLLQVELPLRRLFEAPTVAALAQAVEEARSEAYGGAPAPVERVSREHPLPLSYAQQRIWFLRQFETDPTLYNMLSVLRIEGDLQVSVLERAMEGIVWRHEVLRTSFVEDQGVPMQVINPPWPVQIPVIDLRAGEADPKAEVERLIQEEVQRPFDLARGRLLRVKLVRVGDAEHIYLVGMHHIAGDGWSMEVFLQDLAALYDAFLLDKPSPLPELPFQYADYATWQRSWLEGEVMERQLNYWKAQLKGMPHAIELPTIGLRPTALSHRGRQYSFMLSRELSASIQALSRAHGATLFVTLLAALQALLSRYSGQTDIVVGGAIANRSGQMDALMGFFVNSLVLRADLSGRPSFAELLHRVQKVTMGALANQDVPFERLVEELQPQRDLSRTPLFQVMFDLQRPMSIQSASLAITEEAFEFPMEKFDLSLRIVAVRDGFKGIFLYQTDLFDAETIVGIARHLEILLAGVTASPERPIEEIPLLTKEEELLLGEWNRTERAYPSDRGLQELFERQVEADPQALALVQGSSRLTYRDLNRRANQLAHYLLSRGVGPEIPVALCLDRGVEMVVGMLAILKAGGAYVPLDPGYPADRLEYMIGDIASRLVITEDAFLGRFWDIDTDTVSIESLRDEVASLSAENPPRANAGDDLAYVIYTSGSTGVPKGIMVSHRAITRLVINTDYVDIRPGDRIAQVSNASFDAATFEIWGALLNGAALVVIDKDIALSPAELSRQLRRERVTTMFVTTALFNQTVQADRDAFQGLRYVLFGGEAVDPRWVGEVLGGARPESLLHVYGPTETTTFATWFPVREVEPGCRTIPIGGPIANTRAYVLNEYLRPTPPGLPGEIYIGGPGVARGYWRNPELTAGRFVPDPFSKEGGEQLYRTGDRARYGNDGAIEFLGRTDDQVKLRGYRIEIGEIEASLKRHEAVKDAMVILREEEGEKRLVGYVVGKPGESLMGNALREWLKKRLPDYMAPSAIVILPELPLNANGKLDRRALPEPEVTSATVWRAPRTPEEEILCLLFADALGVARVGIDDDFFELGGHSLLATRLVSRIRATLGVELAIRTLFESPSVAALGRRLVRASRERAPLVRQERPERLPLSYAQQRLWFLDRLEGASTEYNMPEALRLRGELDREALVKAVNTIVERHEDLRTRFADVVGEPAQVIEPELRIELPLEDLSLLDDVEREARVLAALSYEAGEPFDLSRGPLLRMKLLKLGDGEHILLRTMHHIVSDGWSEGIFNHELTLLYEAFLEKKENPLPPMAVQYADFAIWQREWQEDEWLSRELAYWKEQLAGIPERLELPADRPRPTAQTFAADLCMVKLNAGQAAGLKQLSGSRQSTLYMTMLAAFGVLLSRYSGQNDIVVGSPVANRQEAQLEGLIGFFVNSLVMRVRVGPEQRFEELLGEVRRTALEAYEHQDVPFERLVEELSPERSLNTTPLFQVLFALQNAPWVAGRMKGLEVEPLTLVESDLLRVCFDLEAHAWEDGGEIVIFWLYNRDLYDRWRMEQMLRHYLRVLEAVTANPEELIGEIDLLGEEEHRQILEEWSGVTLEIPQATLADMFEEQVCRTPAAMAVVYEGHELTYSGLNERANRLARLLIADGIGPEDVVAVAMPRSSEMIVSLVGILKAGAAYLPIDPDYPADRIAFMLEDAGSACVITTSERAAKLPAQQRRLLVDPPDMSSSAYLAGPAQAQEPRHGADPAANPRDWERVRPLSPCNPAYVIYTSGSTGKPKGAVIQHKAIVNRLEWMRRHFDIAPDDRILQKTPIIFDVSVWELFLPLMTGATVVVAPPDSHKDPVWLASIVREQRITTMHFVPSMLESFIAEPAAAGITLRRVFCSGEELTARLRDRFHTVVSAELHNLYGPTEAAVDVTSWAAMPEDDSVPVPIGYPVWNTRLYVLDERLRPAPPGAIGELYISGVQLAREYLGRPDLTAERFIPDPFFEGDSLTSQRMYRTGDLARWRRDGAILFLGRSDQQVKIRGFRIEPGEIEAALRECGGVAQAVVIAQAIREGRPEEKRLVGYVVAAPGRHIDSAELKRRLAQRLPDYMAPAAIMPLESLPLTPNGKLDRRALPQPESISSAAWRSPRTPEEEILCSLFAEVLGLERVGIDDNFFEIGGHSLLATRLVSRVQAMLGPKLAIRTVFESPTVASLSPRLRESDIARPPLLRQPRPERLPLSHAQQRLWFLDRLGESSSEYNIPTALHLRGELDLQALERAINAIVSRHESLRTHFAQIDGVPIQIIEPELRIGLLMEDLSAFDEVEQQALVMARRQEEVKQPFDLARGPLLRLKLLKLAERDHILLRTIHHITSDGWSEGLFNRELTLLYQAFREGRENSLPPLAVQYADFALWQRQWFEQEALTADLTYWRRQLAGIPERLHLPTDRARPPVQTFAAQFCQVSLSQEQARGLKQISRDHQATLYMSLLGAFAMLLWRYSGQEDIVIGSPIANRQEAQLEEMIGFFVNTLVMRLRIDGQQSLADLVREAKRVALEAYEHQDLPFERLVEELSPQRSLNTTPIYQVVFALQNAPQVAERMKGLEVEPVMGDELQVHFDLEVHAWEWEGEIIISWLYNRDLFDPWRIEQMGRHYLRVLEALARDAQQRIGRVELLGMQERRQILEEWNRTEREIPEATLVELFEEQVRRRMDAVAVVYEGEELTYRELNERANRLAHLLIGEGVGPENVVGLMVERSFEMIVSLLGILKAGAAYLPIDTSYPAERIAFMLRDAEPALLLSVSGVAERLPESSRRLLLLNRPELARRLEQSSTIDPTDLERIQPLRQQNPAYVIYTSGSTGVPKGVVVTHRGVARLVRNVEYVRLDAGQVILQLAPVSFDASTFEIWGSLLNGGKLVLFAGDVPELEDVGRVVRGEGITTLWLTAGLFQAVVNNRLDDLSDVKQLLAGGDVLGLAEVRRVLERLPECELTNGYGPTEVTTFSCCHRLHPEDCGGVSAPIGSPISNTQVYVLDASLRPAPVGAAGELYIAGEGLARGYLKRPDITAASFVANPYGKRAGERMYRTGDLACWRRDGNLEFLGRVDHQVKIRGFRIEPAEIEAALQQYPEVAQAAVVARADRPGEKWLVGYVVPAPGHRLDPRRLRRLLAQRLPDYMAPAVIMELDALPLTPNGKLDRQALLPPGREDRDLEEYVAPRTELEESLCRIWAEMLQIDRVGITDNFFELGGHSLLAMRVISKVRSDLGMELGLRPLFEWPTVAELAERIEPRPAGTMALSTILPVEDRTNLPLSYAQSRLWFIHQLQPQSVAYNAPLHLRLIGELDRSRLEECLTEVVRRHEILRTSFPARDGQPAQKIHPPGPIEIPLIDLSSLPARERGEVARRLRQQDAEQLFDLARGPLFRATLLRLNAEDHQFLLAMHHIVTDGWSNTILIRELFALWDARNQGKPSPLPEPGLQYADYAVWQQQWLEQDVLKTQLSYWRQQLLHVPVLDLPTDRPRSPVTNHRGAELLFSFNPEQSAILTKWGQQENATLFMTLLAGFQWVLSRYSMQEDITVGTVIANRNRREIEGLIGFFVNSLVLRTDLGGSPTFRELVRRVREVTMSAYTHQDLPFEKLVEDLNPERDLRRSPIFHIRFTLDNEPPPFPAPGGLQVDQIDPELPEVKFELTLAMQSRADGTVGGCLIYAADLFERRTVERMVEQYRSLLAQVIADPDAPLTAVSLIGEEEYRQVIVEWNRTDTEPLRERCVPEMFERLVALTPNATAAVYEGVRISYSALDGKANQLAHYLVELGVGPEVRVGIFMKRGLEMVVAILGVLKAGGAYVPIDPANPSERVAFLLEDAQTPVLLTQEPFLERLPSGWFQTVCVDADWSTIASCSAEAPPSNARPDNLAYVIYTSGSTGSPKAVGIEHRQLVNYVEAVSREMACAPDWKFAFLSSVAADLGNTMLFVPLCLGGELHIISEDRVTSGWRLGEYFREEKIDCTKITPSHLAGLQPAPDLLPARLLVLGGESSNRNWVNELRSLRPGCRIMNHYGPTECTVGAVACRLEHLLANGSENVPLGRPLGNVQVYLLDQTMQPVPVGMAGELYIGGAGVGRVYLGRQELTAERFVPDFFGDRPGARLYRTGDKARWLPDGILEFLGRDDHQVKIRGFRVELAEIESVLKQHQEVAQAAVLLREDRPGHQQLIAYVACRRPDTRSAALSPHIPYDNGSTSVSETAATSQTLQNYLKDHLPHYMAPSAIVVLPAFPLTASGKVDRRALPQPEITADVRPSSIAPRNELERLICKIWAEVLGHDQVGIQDDFFALGGHSLLAIKVISRIESAMGSEIPLVTLFTASTVANLAREIERASSEKQTPLPPLVRVNRADFIHTEK